MYTCITFHLHYTVFIISEHDRHTVSYQLGERIKRQSPESKTFISLPLLSVCVCKLLFDAVITLHYFYLRFKEKKKHGVIIKQSLGFSNTNISCFSLLNQWPVVMLSGEDSWHLLLDVVLPGLDCGQLLVLQPSAWCLPPETSFEITLTLVTWPFLKVKNMSPFGSKYLANGAVIPFNARM